MKKRLLKFLAGAAVLAVPMAIAMLFLRFTGATGAFAGVAAGLFGSFVFGILISAFWIITGKGLMEFLDWMEQ